MWARLASPSWTRGLTASHGRYIRRPAFNGMVAGKWRSRMGRIIDRRVCAGMDGGFVVFLIGMRGNKAREGWERVPVATAHPRELVQVGKQPGLGLLHA